MKSLRSRITAVSTIVLVVVLAVASFVIVQLVDQQLRSDLRAQNQETLRTIADQIAGGADPALLALPVGSDGTEFIIETVDGEYVNSTVLTFDQAEDLGIDSFDVEELPEVLDGVFSTDEGEIFLPMSSALADSTEAISPNGETWVISALSTTEVIDRNVGQVRSVLWVVIPVLALLFGGLVWLLTGRVLRPVDAMTRKVSEITSDTLHERLVEPDVSDEIGRLASTLNSMLDRLDRGAKLQQQFVSDASHELRSPLTLLMGEAELAASTGDPTRIAAANQLVIEQSHRMSTLIDDLLHLARTGESLLHSVDIDIDDVLRTLAAQQPGDIDTTAVSPARIRGDLSGISRLVRNLLDNATRHARSQVLVTSTASATAVTLTVEDDGPGVPVADRSRVFERFARLDEARSRADGGTGLGLAIAHAIVEAHDGSIAVDDSALGGARFVVTLPVVSS